MTEADWTSSTDPQAMLDFLRANGQTSGRALPRWPGDAGRVVAARAWRRA